MSLIKGYDTVCKLDVYNTLFNQIKADSWHSNKFFIGRYLTDTPGCDPKKLSKEEVEKLCKAGIEIVSIFQTNVFNKDNYNYGTGVANAKSAIAAAKNIGQPSNTPIYFATEPNFKDKDHEKTNGLTTQDITIAHDYLNGVNSVLKSTSQNPTGYILAAYAPSELCRHIHSWFPSAPIMCGQPHDSFNSWAIYQEYKPAGYNGKLEGKVDFNTAKSTSYGGWHKHCYPNSWENYSNIRHRRKCLICDKYTYAPHKPDSNGICIECGRTGLPMPKSIGEENE